MHVRKLNCALKSTALYKSARLVLTVTAAVTACFGAAFQNGSFEVGTIPPHGGVTLAAGSGSIAGWVVLPANVDWIDFVGLAKASNGTWFLDLSGTSPGGIQQTFDTVAGAEYIITFDMNANSADGQTGTKTLAVSAAGTSETFTFTGTDINAGNPWISKTFRFIATDSQSTLAFSSLTAGNHGPLLDNVRVVRSPSCTFDPAPLGDIRLSGDFDGDGKPDVVVWLHSTGTWYILPSSNPSVPIVQQWGFLGDIPVLGDYDGDGKPDFAVWRPSEGTWYILPSSSPSVPVVQQWGSPGDIPVPGDYDGDGKLDFAVWRPSEGNWYILPSSNPSVPVVQQWGFPGDIPMPGDYDGDGKSDFAVLRPSEGIWYILASSNPTKPIIRH